MNKGNNGVSPASKGDDRKRPLNNAEIIGLFRHLAMAGDERSMIADASKALVTASVGVGRFQPTVTLRVPAQVAESMAAAPGEGEFEVIVAIIHRDVVNDMRDAAEVPLIVKPGGGGLVVPS